MSLHTVVPNGSLSQSDLELVRAIAEHFAYDAPYPSFGGDRRGFGVAVLAMLEDREALEAKVYELETAEAEVDAGQYVQFDEPKDITAMFTQLGVVLGTLDTLGDNADYGTKASNLIETAKTAIDNLVSDLTDNFGPFARANSLKLDDAVAAGVKQVKK